MNIIEQYIYDFYDRDPVPLNAIVRFYREQYPKLTRSAAERQVRRIIAETDQPIGSHPGGGYMWIRTQEEMDLVSANIWSRIIKMQKRLSSVEKAFYASRPPYQPQLFTPRAEKAYRP